MLKDVLLCTVESHVSGAKGAAALRPGWRNTQDRWLQRGSAVMRKGKQLCFSNICCFL